MKRSKNIDLIMLGRPYISGWFISTAIFVASTVTQLTVPLFLSELIDSLSMMEVRVDLIFLIIALNIATLITGIVLEYSFDYYSNRCAMDMRRRLFSHILDIRPLAFAEESTGNLMSVIAMDVPPVSRIACTFVPIIAGNTFSFIFAICILSMLSPQLLLLSFFFVPFYLLAWKKEYGPMLESGRGERERTGAINERVREGIESIMMIKLYRAKNFFLKYFDRVQEEWFGHLKRLLIHQGLLDGAILAIDWIAPYIILGVGVFMVTNGAITIGKLIAFFTSMHLFFDRLSAIFRNVSNFPHAVSAYERIERVLKNPAETIRDGLPFPAKCDIRVEELQFSYNSRKVIDRLNLEIKDGEKVAIVGATGSGKSTLAKIITGYYDGYDGKILLNSRELSEYSTLELRDRIAYVDGSSPLFNLSIRENITLGKEYEKEELESAIGIAEIDFAGDMDALVGEGGSLLSLGQKQRINLARALIRKPKILILDEATSGVDSEKELKIYQKLRTMECTIIVISHRLSTITQTDCIYLLMDGKIIDSGMHSDLLTRNGYYREMVRGQLIS